MLDVNTYMAELVLPFHALNLIRKAQRGKGKPLVF